MKNASYFISISVLKIFKFFYPVSKNALKMYSPALSVLRFLYKIFSKLLKFTLKSTPLCGLSFKKFIFYSYGIQINSLYDYKLVRAGKRSEKMQQVVQKESHKTM